IKKQETLKQSKPGQQYWLPVVWAVYTGTLQIQLLQQATVLPWHTGRKPQSRIWRLYNFIPQRCMIINTDSHFLSLKLYEALELICGMKMGMGLCRIMMIGLN